MRIGIGYDVHRFEKDRKLIIGGVQIPYEYGLKGHSDADVLTHAIMDSLLGAAALKDIGTYFPDNKEEFKNINSLKLLEKVKELLKEKDYKIINIDSIIIAQEPKMAPYIDKMKEKISQTLQIPIESVGIKATTTEKLGFEGRKEGISSQAVALIEKITK